MKIRVFSILVILSVCLSLVASIAPPLITPVSAASELHVGSGQPYSTIQAAVNAATAGDTVVVHPGTYNEQILIDKQLTVKSSDGANSTIIDGMQGTAYEFQRPANLPPHPGNPPPPGTLYPYYPVVRIDADGVVFQGFTVKDAAPLQLLPDDPLPCGGMGIAVIASNCHVENNIIQGGPWGMFVWGSNNIVYGNSTTMVLDPAEPEAWSWEGIYVLGNNNKVDTNTMSGVAFGIVAVGWQNRITGNTTDFYAYGIAIISEYQWVSAYDEIRSNHVYDSVSGGISVYGDHHIIAGNTIAKNERDSAVYSGIGLNNAQDCQVLDNLVSDVVIGGISLDNSHYNVISGNTISDFVTCEVEKIGTAKLQWTGERSVFELTSAKVYSGDSPGDGVIIKLPAFWGALSFSHDGGPMFWAYLYDPNARPRVNFVLDVDGDGTADEVMEGVDTQVVCPDSWEPSVPCTPDAEAWRAMTPSGGYYDADNSAGQGWDVTPASWDQWQAQFPSAVIVEIQTIYGMWDDMSGKTAYLDGHFDGNRWGIEQSGMGIAYINSYNNIEFNNTILDALIADAVSQDIVGAQTDYMVSGSSGSDTTVTVTTTTNVTVTVTLYAQNPEPTVPFPDTALGKFVDIQVSDPDAIVWPARVEVTYTAAEVAAAGVEEDTLALYYWNYGTNSFQKCSDTGVDTASKTIWADVTEEEASRLVGTPFAAGGGTLTAGNDNYSMDEDNILNVAAAGVLGNDSDPDHDPITAQLVGNAGHGVLVLQTDGSFRYTPNAHFNGADSFTYKATDGQNESNVATVNITINPVNDAPSAVDNAWSTQEDSTLVVVAPGVLGNDSDIEGTSLTAVLVSNVSHGTLSLSSDGSFIYTPSADFNGADSFTYRANDGTDNSGIATVSLTVVAINDPPQATDDIYEVTKGDTLSEDAPGLLANDSDVDGNPLTAILVSDVSHGTLVLNADGSFTYTPAANFTGSDVFTYKANDGTTDSKPVTVTITVNDVPPSGGVPAWIWIVIGIAGAAGAGIVAYFVRRRLTQKT